MNQDLILGVDGGGTSTVVWLADRSGTVLGRGKASGSNQKVVGQEVALQAIRRAIQGAFENAGIEPTKVKSICLGMAGFDRPEDREVLKSWAWQFEWSQHVCTTNDAELVVAAGLGSDAGVALICGTGSMALGQSSDGRKTRVGGLGPILGDEGSAWHVATEALRLVAQRLDARDHPPEPDRLTEDLLDALGARSLSDMIRTIYDPRSDRASIAALAPFAVEAIDPMIDRLGWERVVEQPSWQLGSLVIAAAQRLKLEMAPLIVVLGGGFVLSCEPYRTLFERSLERRTPREPEIRIVPEPVAGAIKLARGMLE